MEIRYVTANGIRLCIRDYDGKGTTLVMLHGLTANGAAFDGLMAAGLPKMARVISVDLRGRGLSEAPATGYSIAQHAQDIAALLLSEGITNVVLAGHSFGAFLSWYLAVNYPDTVKAVVAMDAGMRMHPNTLEMLKPSLGRLGKHYPDFETYLNVVKQAPYLDFWDDAMASYYMADIKSLDEGGVMPIPKPANMTEAATLVLSEPWPTLIPQVSQPVLMVYAPGIYALNAPLLPEPYALETAQLLRNCTLEKVPGNHQTMLYGEGALAICTAVQNFLAHNGLLQNTA